MDTPKRQVSLLENSPPDIWAYFAWYLPGEQLGRLMMTGATILWQRLKSPGVVKSINLGKDYLVFKSFPAFLRELPSLEELTIDSLNDDWIAKLGIKIDLLPSGLRKLELTGKFDQPAYNLFGEAGATLKLCNHLPHLEAIDLSTYNVPDSSWIAHSPQSLTILSLNRWIGDVELPSCLINLTACSIDLSTEYFVNKLPLNLESFVVLNDFRGFDLALPLLPPSTRKLYLGGYISDSGREVSAQKCLEQLPKSLTCFQVPASDLFDFELNPELITLLPPTLTEFDLQSILPCSACPRLPQLRKLSFQVHGELSTVISTITDNDGTQHKVESFPFDSLPRSITNLELVTAYSDRVLCGPPALTNQSYFPPHVTYLNIPDFLICPASAKLLPSSLTYLSVRNLCERVCEHLPRSLKTLIALETLMSPNLIKFLPRSLTFLRLFLAIDRSPWLDYNTGKTIDDVSTLPEYIVHTNCISNSFDWKDSTPLPPTLTYFSLLNAYHIGDSLIKYQQLPNLLKLEMGDSQHFTNLSIPLLSPHLTTLELGYSSQVTGKSFPLLPKCLTVLKLDSSQSIFDCDIPHLPRTLKYANLDQAIHLTDLCIPDLPRHLEKLSLRKNYHITPSSLPYFPYALRSYQNYAQFANWGISEGVILTKIKG